MRPRVLTGIGRTRSISARRLPAHASVATTLCRSNSVVSRSYVRVSGSSDAPVDPQLPLLRRDVRERAVIACIERIDRSDVATRQYRRRWLSVVRQTPAHDHVVALTPPAVGLRRCDRLHIDLDIGIVRRLPAGSGVGVGELTSFTCARPQLSQVRLVCPSAEDHRAFLSTHMPELSAFEVFLAIARTGSLGAAGREFG